MSQSAPAHSENSNARVKPSRFSAIGKRLLLLGSTLLILAGTLEIGTRLFTDITPPLLVKDPVIGKRFQRSLQTRVYVPEAQRKIDLRFNSYGFRGSDRSLEKPAGVRRVAVIGDSFIASIAVNEEHTLVSRLEQMLNESNPQVTWEVMNFGVPGSGPGQEIALYRELVSQFQPDVVLGAFFVGNDLADNCNRLSNQDRIYFDFDDAGNYRQLPFSASRTSLSRFLNRHSRFYVWQKVASKQARDTARETLRIIPPGAWVYCRDEQPEDVAYAWRLTESAIATLSREVTQQGSLFAQILIPTSEQVYKDRWEDMVTLDPKYQESFDWNHPDERITEICKKLDVPLVAMTEEFRSAAPSASSKVQEQWLFHQGAGHFNERGNEIACQVIHRFLTRSNAQLAGAAPFVNLLR